MPWNVTVDFADPRPRHTAHVPGDTGLSLGIEAALKDAGIQWARYADLVDGERTGGYQITVTPAE